MTQIPLLQSDPSARREWDYYPTPSWMVRALLRRVTPCRVLEPCSGYNAIADALREVGIGSVTNDLNPDTPADTHEDATDPAFWVKQDAWWVVTNVPFNLADRIVPLAVERIGYVATVLRLSWLEPTGTRGEWLAAHPPSRLIVLPRHDFKGRGQTDSVTSAWMVWERGSHAQSIEIVSKAERDALIGAEEGR